MIEQSGLGVRYIGGRTPGTAASAGKISLWSRRVRIDASNGWDNDEARALVAMRILRKWRGRTCARERF